MHFLQAINSDLSVLIVCNKTGGTIKGEKKNIPSQSYPVHATPFHYLRTHFNITLPLRLDTRA